jgi:hypothetical protein
VRLLVVLLVAAVSLAAITARAEAPAVAVQAHEAYERGTAAYRRGDYATAAREYAAADALSPSPVALQAALDAALRADDPVVGTTLLERASARPRTGGLDSIVAAAERRFAKLTGHVRFACGARACLASIDGAAVDASQSVVVRVGAHTVIVQSDGASATQSVTVGPDETVEVRAPHNPPPAPPPAAPAVAPTSAAPGDRGARPGPSPGNAGAEPPQAPDSEERRGLPRAWFIVGLVATGVAGGAAIASGVDTLDKHSSFVGDCQGAVIASGAHCGQRGVDGQSAQMRTDVLVGVTGGLAAATAVTALFVRWHDVRLAAGPAVVTLAGRF